MRLFSKLVAVFATFTSLVKPAEKVDWILRARYIVTMNSTQQIIENGAIAVKGMRIAAVDTQAAIAQEFTADHVLDKPNAVVMPGLIDTHTHAPMSLFRAIADDRRLEDWLHNYIFPAESKNVTPDFVRWGTRLACMEMVLAGITTYTDMYYFEEVEAEIAKEMGVRGVLGQTVIGFPAPDYKTWQDALQETERFIKRFRNDELIVPAVAPHAIYTTPNEALIAAHQLAVKYGVPLVIHLAETSTERDGSMTKRGKTPTQALESLGVLDGRVIAAHSIWMDDNDLRILERHNTGVAHCPTSNMKLADGVAHITSMLKAGIHVGLGNDGFAGSNDGADLLREAALAAKLQKVTLMDPTVIPAEQALEIATMGGARVLGMENEIGSLERGKRADMVALSLANPDCVPLYNLYSVIVYSAHPGDVEDVFINGRQIVSERHVLTVDKAQVLAKAEAYKKQILASLRQ